MAGARATPKALDVVDFALRPHHEVALAEGEAALVAFRAEQSENRHTVIGGRIYK